MSDSQGSLPKRRDASRWGLQPKAQYLSQLLLNDHPLLYITSGRRTPQQNRRIKGATLNGHTTGDEVDFGGPRLTRERAAAQARRTKGARVVDKPHGTGPHVHVRWPA